MSRIEVSWTYSGDEDAQVYWCGDGASSYPGESSISSEPNFDFGFKTRVVLADTGLP